MKKFIKVVGIILIIVIVVLLIKHFIIKDDEEELIVDHNVNIVEIYEATDIEYGYSLYECSDNDCNYKFRGNLTHKLNNLYGYNYFDNKDKNLSNIYQQIDYLCKNIDDKNIESLTIKVESEEMVIYNLGKINLKSVSLDDALKVWTIFYNENPWYYFLDNKIVYSSDYLYINIYEEYKDNKTRNNIKKELLKLEADVSQLINNEISDYEKVKVIHDFIANRIDYAFDPITNEASLEPWAHNIVGILENNLGVCECYAKTFYYLCCLFNIKCIMVTGDVKEGHIYNYVCIADNWYGVDVTWDDQGQDILDKYLLADGITMSDHNPRGEENEGILFQYELPLLS